ncbi:MAG TPA: hypothetical protein VN851_00725 [Thermoanaerobaculia bacterium]|nr:hypothetical protein [Thermoanaerobaculia bacterium]
MAATTGNAPKNITWIICLVLYLIALAGTFHIVSQITGQVTMWSWIIGFGLLLVAVRVRGL